MSQKEKRRHLFKVFIKSKALFACFSIALSLLLVVGSTYAWITSSDERVNRAKPNLRRVSAIVEGDFDQVFHWAPGTTKDRNVRVRNTGDMPAFVRISLKESFAVFETLTNDNHADREGNGNLKIYGTPSLEAISVKNTSTWVGGNTYEVSADKYYKATNDTFADHTYLYKGTREDVVKGIELNFEPGKVFDKNNLPGTSDKKYWFYENGYFYYSEILQPQEVTPNLLDSVSLRADYENQHKGALYKLVPKMDAHDLTQAPPSDWNIDSNGYGYTMFQKMMDGLP